MKKITDEVPRNVGKYCEACGDTESIISAYFGEAFNKYAVHLDFLCDRCIKHYERKRREN
jgi:hypothetical protein